MNLRDAKQEIKYSIMAGNAVLLKSASGIGKSQVLYQIFNELKAEGEKVGESWGFGTIFAATQTPPDLIGYQYKGERSFKVNGAEEPVKVTVSDPSIPLWMISTEGKPAFMYDRFFLLIDEYGQGEADVKRATAEIFLNGGTAPWYLPQGSVRVAATNVGQRYGVTKDFDFCIARRTEITITGDVDVWIEDFADKPYVFQGRKWQVMPVIKAFAKTHPEILFESEPKEQGPWCNPRTLTAFDRYLQVKAEAKNGEIPTDPGTISVGAGMIGMGATTQIMGHIAFRTQLPSYEDVVKDPTGTPTPKKADLQMLMAYEMAHHTKEKDLAEVVTYMDRLPKDMAVTYVSSLLRRDYQRVINEPAMKAWIKKNAGLVSIIASLQ